MNAVERAAERLLRDMNGIRAPATSVETTKGVLHELSDVFVRMYYDYTILRKTTSDTGYEKYVMIADKMRVANDTSTCMSERRAMLHAVYTDDSVCSLYDVEDPLKRLKDALSSVPRSEEEHLQPIDMYIDDIRVVLHKMASKIVIMMIGYALGDNVK